MGTDRMSFPIPDIVLRDAYRTVAQEEGVYREKFAARTELIERVRLECGPEYAHVPVDHIRDRIIVCAKSPKQHGGGWSVANGTGPDTHAKLEESYSSEIEGSVYSRLDEPDWPSLKHAARVRAGFRCQICNCAKVLDTHHRCYDSMRTDQEIDDLVCLCRKCHRIYHDKIQGLPNDLFE